MPSSLDLVIWSSNEIGSLGCPCVDVFVCYCTYSSPGMTWDQGLPLSGQVWGWYHHILGSIRRDNRVILQCWLSSSTLADTCSLKHPGYTTLQFQLYFGPTRQLRDLGLCLGSSPINQNSKLTLLRSPEVLRLWIQQLLWIKTLQLARVIARIPTTGTVERGSGLC